MDARTETTFDRLDAIESALTPAVLNQVYAFARRRCQMLERAGLSGDAEELLWSAISDTTEGKCTWHHDRYELGIHLCGVISGRTARMVERGLHVRYYRFGVADDDDGHDVTELRASEAMPTDDPEAATARRDLVHRVVDVLLEMAAASKDNQVVRILDSYRQGITERCDVAEHIGLSLKKYDHARKRLMRMVAKLPEELRSSGSVMSNG